MNNQTDKVIIVSACLLGVNCRYSGMSKKDDKVIEFLVGKNFVPVCPESFSGLPIPREPADFDRGDGTMTKTGKNQVIQRDGTDVTKQFLRGATEAMKICKLAHATSAILKDRSPSCGVHQVYNEGALVNGVGILTAMLMQEGVKVISEKDI
jgi:uncharacterized protein YbbK (DUF523 family)